MKKKISVLLFSLLLFGCQSQVADQELVCFLSTTSEESTYTSLATFTYRNETKEMYSGVVKEQYTNMEKTQTNNDILQKRMMRKEVAQEVNGVEIETKITNFDFEFIEKWDYQKVKVNELNDIFDDQKQFIENEKYNLKKIEAHYYELGYSCNRQKLK